MFILIIGILIILIIVLLLAVYVKKKRVAKAATIVRNSSETIVDNAIKYIATNLRSNGINFTGTVGNSVADVWGQSVIGFNYKADLNRKLENQDIFIKELESKINGLLQEFSIKHQLEDQNGPLLRVSDIWIHDQVLELDIVYLINQQTKDYLKDLSKL